MEVLVAAVLALLLCQPLSAERLFTIPAENAWDTWDYPRGLMTIEGDGIHVRRFTKEVNAVADAGEFAAKAIGPHGTRLARTPTNQAAVDRLRDQRPDTWWAPAASAPLEDWWVEIDLGRIVLASRIRLTFPDTTGARPFRFFSVYTSPGLPISASPEDIYFTRVGGTIKANTSQVAEFELSARNPADATGPYLDTSDRLSFDPIRFVRFVAEARLEDAALAEVEVETIGENIALKVEAWGGTIYASPRSAGVEKLINGDLNSQGSWGIEHNAGRQEGWRPAGMWFKLDMLSTFRVDRVVWLPVVQNVTPWFYSLDNDRAAGWEGTSLKTSDGTPAAAIAGVTTEEGNFTYQMLSEINNQVSAKSWIFDLQFPTRAVRLLFWYYDRLLSFTWTRALQIFVYHAEGYPARVALTSGYIDFGGARSISRIQWDALVPPGTDIEVQSKTGNTFEVTKHYFAKQGTQEVEVTEDRYNKLPKVAQGSILEETRPGSDWSDWSPVHRISGTAFLSPTPRRYLQLRVYLNSDDPEAMPVLHSLSLAYNPPLIAGGLTGQIEPRFVPLDSLVAFRYTVWPQYRSGDSGFDQVTLQVPGTAEEVGARIRGLEVGSTARQSGDSLVVELGQRVLRDSVEISFRARLLENPTVFDAAVMNSGIPDVWQGVVARSAEADKVYVPAIYQQASFFHDISLDPVFTPNGDGINDLLNLRVGLVRIEGPPQVRVYRLDGADVADLAPLQAGTIPLVYQWDGRDRQDRMAAPGIYLLRLRVQTDAGDEEHTRLVTIAY